MAVVEWAIAAIGWAVAASGWAAYFRERRLSRVRLGAKLVSTGYGHTNERAKALFDLELRNMGRVPAVIERAALVLEKQSTQFVPVPVEGHAILEGVRLEAGQKAFTKLRFEARPGFDPSHLSGSLAVRLMSGDSFEIPFRFGNKSAIERTVSLKG